MKGLPARNRRREHRSRYGAAWLISSVVLRANFAQAQQSPEAARGPDARGAEVSHGPDAQSAEASPSTPVVTDATRAAVRKLADAGVSAYRSGDFEGASEKLEKAYQLMPVPSLALWSARALAARGAWTRAAERYLSARRLAPGPGDPRIQEQAREVAAAERAALVPRIPNLRVKVEGVAPSEVTVTVDDAALPPLLIGEDWPVNPGTHSIVGVHGSERVEATASVAEGQHAEVSLRFVAPASLLSTRPAATPGGLDTPNVPNASVVVAPSDAWIEAREEALAQNASGPAREAVASDAHGSALQTAGWLTLGVGGATLLTSGVLGLVASQKRQELRATDGCVGSSCLKSDDVETYNLLVDLSTGGWMTGAALMGAGTVLLLTVPGSGGATRVAVTPSTVGIVGRF